MNSHLDFLFFCNHIKITCMCPSERGKNLADIVKKINNRHMTLISNYLLCQLIKVVVLR